MELTELSLLKTGGYKYRTPTGHDAFANGVESLVPKISCKFIYHFCKYSNYHFSGATELLNFCKYISGRMMYSLKALQNGHAPCGEFITSIDDEYDNDFNNMYKAVEICYQAIDKIHSKTEIFTLNTVYTELFSKIFDASQITMKLQPGVNIPTSLQNMKTKTSKEGSGFTLNYKFLMIHLMYGMIALIDEYFEVYTKIHNDVAFLGIAYDKTVTIHDFLPVYKKLEEIYKILFPNEEIVAYYHKIGYTPLSNLDYDIFSYGVFNYITMEGDLFLTPGTTLPKDEYYRFTNILR